MKFTNPDDPADSFVVESLVEAMALLARHKARLPKPTRIPRFPAAAEARLNATDASLSPHAGGLIRFWSKPIDGEIRDDQGISMPNPDTGMFMRYHVAGAYDSNIALLLTKGEDRLDSYVHLSKVLRKTSLRGVNLATNLQFHYGLVNWFLGQNVMAKPTTRFVVPVPHAGRPPRGGGEQARHGVRLRGDEEALHGADREGEPGRSRPSSRRWRR